MSKSKSYRGRAYTRKQRFRIRNKIRKLLRLQRWSQVDEEEVPKLEKSRPRRSVHCDDPWCDRCGTGRWYINERYFGLKPKERVADISEKEQRDEIDRHKGSSDSDRPGREDQDEAERES